MKPKSKTEITEKWSDVQALKTFRFFLKHVDWWVHHCRGLPMSLRRYIFRKYLSMSTTSNLAFYHENAARKVYPYVIFLFRNTSCFDKELDCLWSHSGGGRLWTWGPQKNVRPQTSSLQEMQSESSPHFAHFLSLVRFLDKGKSQQKTVAINGVALGVAF